MSSHSQSFSGCSSRTRGSYPEVKCYHGEISPLRCVKHNGPTMGKKFFGCAYWPKTCGFFKWANYLDDIRELQMLVFEKDTKIAELKMEKDFLQDKVKELKGKNTLLAIYSARADRKLIVALAVLKFCRLFLLSVVIWLGCGNMVRL
ncbi:DNA topoisomerase 3-alpha, partial [Bienertia sinuspersici]